jgi:hypothetical protein
VGTLRSRSWSDCDAATAERIAGVRVAPDRGDLVADLTREQPDAGDAEECAGTILDRLHHGHDDAPSSRR